MTYIFNMLLNVGHTDLFNTVSQYLALEWFKTVFLCQAFTAGDTPCPFLVWSGEHNPDLKEGVG